MGIDCGHYIAMFTPSTWQSFLDDRAFDRRKPYMKYGGLRELGFKTDKYVKNVQPGDEFICYLTGRDDADGASKYHEKQFSGIGVARSTPYKSSRPLWGTTEGETNYEWRVMVELVTVLESDRTLSLDQAREITGNRNIQVHLAHGSPARMTTDDQRELYAKLRDAVDKRSKILSSERKKRVWRRGVAFAAAVAVMMVALIDLSSLVSGLSVGVVTSAAFAGLGWLWKGDQ